MKRKIIKTDDVEPINCIGQSKTKDGDFWIIEEEELIDVMKDILAELKK